MITPNKPTAQLKKQIDLSLETTPSDAVSNEIKKQRGKNETRKEDIKVKRNLGNQTALQNQILANQKDVMVTMANGKIMRIDILTISASCHPFCEWNQKIHEIIQKEKEKELKMNM
ncbi:hypothetical protein VP01_2464g2 [Puccinia sorghi]|uniref:No apical meristem-associated C-terminal domain-containing protein n=1 Tax=Puccinia sorghi TaxID=27349 RepID=A0A0L6V686_9BASI|nr:hypothetical protein VP01_2464g2 [Puccinia sorghi]